jgi:AbrB family looped-hinge helix DNA binding protein
MNFILVRRMEQEVAVIGERGQVVIPKEVRVRLGLKPKTKLLVVREGDAVIMKKLDLEQERRELKALFKKVDKRIEKYGEMTEGEIDQIIHDYRARTAYKGK